MSSEAAESAWLYEFLAWVEINKKRLIVAAVILFVAGFGIATYHWWAGQREEAAYAALFRLGIPVSLSEMTAPPSADSYLKLAEEYPHTRAGEQAMLLAAGELFKAGQYDQARSQFKTFLDQYGSSDLAPSAAFGLASALDALNRTNEAQQAYQEVIAHYASSSMAAQARLALARLFDAGHQPEQALKIYNQMLQSTTPDTWTAEARARREELLFRHPALAASETSLAPGLPPTVLQPSLPTTAPANPVTAPAANPTPGKGSANRSPATPGKPSR